MTPRRKASGIDTQSFTTTALDGEVEAHQPPASHCCGILTSINRKIWKAAELEQMTPAERHALFEASVVTDLDTVAADPLLERTRRRVEQMITESGPTSST